MKISFKVESDLNALTVVLAYFERLDSSAISKRDWLQCQLALVEGFTNAVRHAHKNLSRDTPIEIQIELDPLKMELRIWDRGEPFDLDNYIYQYPDLEDKPVERGQGIPLLKRIADYLSYSRTEDDRNCLWLVKKFSPPPS